MVFARNTFSHRVCNRKWGGRKEMFFMKGKINGVIRRESQVKGNQEMKSWRNKCIIRSRSISPLQIRKHESFSLSLSLPWWEPESRGIEKTGAGEESGWTRTWKISAPEMLQDVKWKHEGNEETSLRVASTSFATDHQVFLSVWGDGQKWREWNRRPALLLFCPTRSFPPHFSSLHSLESGFDPCMNWMKRHLVLSPSY